MNVSHPRLKFKVEQRHIDTGVKCHGQKCALALAIMEAIGAEDIGVDPLGIEIGENEAGVPAGYYACPSEMEGFIEAFDDDKSLVSPREFDCELIPQASDDEDDEGDWCDSEEDDWGDDDDDDWLDYDD